MKRPPCENCILLAKCRERAKPLDLYSYTSSCILLLNYLKEYDIHTQEYETVHKILCGVTSEEYVDKKIGYDRLNHKFINVLS